MTLGELFNQDPRNVSSEGIHHVKVNIFHSLSIRRERIKSNNNINVQLWRILIMIIIIIIIYSCAIYGYSIDTILVTLIGCNIIFSVILISEWQIIEARAL